jgi:hypothetical protein
MDNLDTPAPAQPDAEDLQSQCDDLRRLVISVLILLIVVSGTFTIYLQRQYRTTSYEVAMLGPQVRAEMVPYSRAKPGMDDFIRQIVEYSRTHPDFTPILNKYGIKPLATPPASGPAEKK